MTPYDWQTLYRAHTPNQRWVADWVNSMDKHHASQPQPVDPMARLRAAASEVRATIGEPGMADALANLLNMLR